MCKDLPDRQIIKLEYILYENLFIFIDGAGFTACFDHHAYIFFTNLFFRFVRIDTKHP